MTTAKKDLATPSGSNFENETTESDPGFGNAHLQQVEGSWKQFTGRVQEAWGVLTDDDIDRAEGKLDRLAGTIEEKTGEARVKVARKLRELAQTVKS